VTTTRSLLAGIRVVEFADTVSSACTRVLADLGASVLTVPPPRRGGAAQPFPGSAGHARSFFDARKQPIGASPASPRDLPTILSTLGVVDVCVESCGQNEMTALGLDYDSVAAINPALVYASITPYGRRTGADPRVASDLILQAAGGMVFLNGDPTQAPQQALGLQGYHSTAAYVAIGILIALHERLRSGLGQFLDVSAQACVTASIEHLAALHFTNGRVPTRRGRDHWTGAFRLVRARDGYVLVSTQGDHEVLAAWLADGDENAKPHGADLLDQLERWARPLAAHEIERGARFRRLPFAQAGAVSALRNHPQLRARRFFSRRRAPLIGARISHVARPREDPPISSDGSRLRTQFRPAVATRSPLAGIRVLDLTWVIAGPLATRILADAGADVIKVEHPQQRSVREARHGLSGNLNRGKRSMVIDLACDSGRELLVALAARSDVLVHNFAPRVFPNWGLTTELLARTNPALICLSMTGFGETGPWRDTVAFGPTLQAAAGFCRAMPLGDGSPGGLGFSYADMCAGRGGAALVMAALLARTRHGTSAHLDFSQFESLVANLGSALDCAAAERPPYLPINRSQEDPAAPHGVYPCAPDLRGAVPRARWCALAVFDDGEWAALCDAAKAPHWRDDSRFRNMETRLRNISALDATISAWTRQLPDRTLVRRLQAAGVRATIVHDAADLCGAGSHLDAFGYWRTLETPESDQVHVDGLPFHLSRSPLGPTAAAPVPGEHTDELLREILGLDATERYRLANAGIVRQWSASTAPPDDERLEE